jgi:hypothetical protein
MRVQVAPALIRWARERSGIDPEALAHRFPKLEAWEAGEQQPTLNQLEDFAKSTHAALGLFFLPMPPDEVVPIPDFRTLGGRKVRRPSPNLLDVIYLCQQRQDWYREYLRIIGADQLQFVGSATTRDPVVQTAATMRHTLGFEVEDRKKASTWTEALRTSIARMEDAGVLVMVSGVVGNNNHRPLSPNEFRGFALAD